MEWRNWFRDNSGEIEWIVVEYEGIRKTEKIMGRKIKGIRRRNGKIKGRN